MRLRSEAASAVFVFGEGDSSDPARTRVIGAFVFDVQDAGFHRGKTD